MGLDLLLDDFSGVGRLFVIYIISFWAATWVLRSLMSFRAFCRARFLAVRSSVDFVRASIVFSSWVILFVWSERSWVRVVFKFCNWLSLRCCLSWVARSEVRLLPYKVRVIAWSLRVWVVLALSLLKCEDLH